MATLIFPLSRIEGHARVVVEVQDGRVRSARFEAMERRGFDYFMHGMPAEKLPVITPRICGVCSTAHHLASVKMLEEIYEVTPPPLALTIRELLMLGQTIQNQATSLFIFTMPDRMSVSSIFQLEADPQQTERSSPTDGQDSEIARRALRVRRMGTDLITLAGGQFIHPIKAVVGGVTSGILPQDAEALRQALIDTLPLASELFDLYWQVSVAMMDRLGTGGDNAPACYITAVGDDCPNYYGDLLRVMCADGQMGATFPARELNSHLQWQASHYSYANKTSFDGEVMRANSLARVNMVRRMGTPLADEYLTRFRSAFGSPAHDLLLYDIARGIELVYALERAIELLGEPLDGGEVAVPYEPRDGEGYGLVEAPRGPLVHHCLVRDGLVAEAEFIIPTVHNVMAIERALLVAAERYVKPDRVDMELERAVGRVVRAFDPCIACATH